MFAHAKITKAVNNYVSNSATAIVSSVPDFA